MIAIEECFSLQSFNSFGLKARTRFFAEANSIEDLRTIINVFKDNPLPKLILGGGSNLLFTQDFDGIIYFPSLTGIELIQQDDNNVWIKAYAAENWDNFVKLCVSKNWGGIENLSNIPGTIGACPIQNIGAYGVEAKDTIECVETIDIQNLECKTYTNSECKFGYRDSIFKHELKDKTIIISVTFKLSKKPQIKMKYADVNEAMKSAPEINIAAVRQAIIDIRNKKLPDPSKYGNAGSFFKNPVISTSLLESLKVNYPSIPSYPMDGDFVKLPAAWLIETCGWKGKREGDVGSFPTQPLVIVNYGEATGNDVISFGKKIQQSVLDQFSVKLEMEVNII